jgi:hypothetical protein
MTTLVMPAEAGIQGFPAAGLDSRLRGYDGIPEA